MNREAIETSLMETAAERRYVEEVIDPINEQAKTLGDRLHAAEEQMDTLCDLYGNLSLNRTIATIKDVQLFTVDHPVLGEGKVRVDVVGKEDDRRYSSPVTTQTDHRRNYTLQYRFVSKVDPHLARLLGETTSTDRLRLNGDRKQMPGVWFNPVSLHSTRPQVDQIVEEYLPQREADIAVFEEAVAAINEALQDEERNPHARLKREAKVPCEAESHDALPPEVADAIIKSAHDHSKRAIRQSRSNRRLWPLHRTP